MLEFLRQNPFLVGALTGSLAAYTLGLGVNYLLRRKKWLGYFVSGRRIAERRNPRLVIRYEDRDIDRIHSYTVTLRNIGNVALRDVPVTIQCASPAEVVECEVTAPPGARFTSTIEKPGTVLLHCDLLNRGERAVVGLTTVNSPGVRPSEDIVLAARQEDLDVRKLFPTETPFAHDPAMLVIYRMARVVARMRGDKVA